MRGAIPPLPYAFMSWCLVKYKIRQGLSLSLPTPWNKFSATIPGSYLGCYIIITTVIGVENSTESAKFCIILYTFSAE
jgi:hypothetical protein